MGIIGIDLGTTNSLVAVLDQQGLRTLPNEFDEHLIPSAVAVADDGSVLVGRAAKDRLAVDPSAGRAFFKRDMGTATTYHFGGREWTPQECSAVVLQELKRIAERHVSGPITQAVITVPAYFHDTQRQATMTAARIADLRVARMLNEPTAAALAYGYRQGTEEQEILVVDLGGGTFDVTLLEIFEGIIEVKASAGESRLGGEDYTDAILAWLEERLGIRPAPTELGRLRQRLDIAKRQLSTKPMAQVQWGDREIPLSRENFELATDAITARLRPALRRCLRDGGVDPASLNAVLLVGGAARMPVFRNFLAAELSQPGVLRLDPDRVVGLGAAVQAALCERNEAVDDLVLTDVCAHTLGVEVAKEFTPGRQEPGFFSPIIDRNSTVPLSRVERFRTFHPQQDQVDVKVYQGESRLTAENTLLGTIHVGGLRARPEHRHPGEFDIHFTYDMNGILEVDIHKLSVDEHVIQVIEERPGELTRDEINAAIARLQPVKRGPRQDPVHRARLERANRVWGEVRGEIRAHLGALLDAFEQALQARDAQAIAETGAMLDRFLATHADDAPEADERYRSDGLPEESEPTDDDDGRS